MIRPRYDGSVAQAAISLGYPREDVKNAIVEQIKVLVYATYMHLLTLL